MVRRVLKYIFSDSSTMPTSKTKEWSKMAQAKLWSSQKWKRWPTSRRRRRRRRFNEFQSDKGWTGKQAKRISTCQTFFLETDRDPIAMTDNTQKCLCLFFSSTLLQPMHIWAHTLLTSQKSNAFTWKNLLPPLILNFETLHVTMSILLQPKSFKIWL